MDARLQVYNDKMEKALAHLEGDYQTIRAGRANPHVLDKIKVDYYGTPTPLQQVGNISVPEPRMLQIAPWEKSLIKEIEKAIMMSDVGITPSNDGAVIRLVFPELTEERRKDLVKDVKKKAEDAKGEYILVEMLLCIFTASRRVVLFAICTNLVDGVYYAIEVAYFFNYYTSVWCYKLWNSGCVVYNSRCSASHSFRNGKTKGLGSR